MSTEANKALARRFNEEVFNKGNIQAIDELFSPSYVNHTAPPGLPAGSNGTKVFVTMFRTAFPDLHITLEDIIAEGEKVVTRWLAQGTQQGAFLGVAATGKPIRLSGIDILRIVDGKIVEHWDITDQMGLMQQLGSGPSH